ncbi:argininosuccinate lyase [Alphaproteobacteria bacterium]
MGKLNVVHKVDSKKISVSSDSSNLVSMLSQVESINKLQYGYHPDDLQTSDKPKLSISWHNKRLCSVIIDAYKAQIRMLVKRNIIPGGEGAEITLALDAINQSIMHEEAMPQTEDSHNVHAMIKKLLFSKIGTKAKYLNILYSQQEMYVTSLRLWLRNAMDSLDPAIQNLQSALMDKSEMHIKTIMPSYVHASIGQPTSLGCYLMSYVEMFGRDRASIENVRKNTNRSPMGAYMGAGTSLEISRKMMASGLGFDEVIVNTVDAISDMDFVLGFLHMASICMMHLSRLAEELLIWQHPNSGFIYFSNAFLSADDILNMKYYPNVLEYVRSKSGAVYGNFINALTVMKSLHCGITQDVEEVLEPVIHSYDTLFKCVGIMEAVVVDFGVDRKQMKEKSQEPQGFAPDIVHWFLKSTNLDYNAAVDATRKIINYAIEHEKKLSLLEIHELQTIESSVNSDIYSTLIPSRAITSRRSQGGSNPVQMRKAVRAARKKYLA